MLSLWLDNPSSGSVQRFQVNWIASGAAASTLYGVTNPPAFSWTNLQFIVPATSSTTVLQFGAENDPSYFGLDDVSVTPIPSATFRVTAKTTDSFSLTWNTASGLTYQVQYTTNLSQPNWINLGTPTVATGSWLTLADTNGVQSAPERFYRLVVSP